MLVLGCRGRQASEDEEPAERIICLSTSHVAFLTELGEADRIVDYQRTIDLERILSLKPDLVLVSWSEEGARLRQMGLRCEVVEEWLETTPLGRAEWIVRIAEFCGVREKGEERFAEISRAYNELAAQVASRTQKRPRVMLNAPYRDVWYVPGDDNYMVRLIEDAGGEWIFSRPGSESYPIDIEQAWLAMQEADVWLNTNDYDSLTALLVDNSRFKETRPVLAGQVFNNNARVTPQGGSDFWESGVVRPDRILRDLVQILHPGNLASDTLYYYRRLQ